ncbi:uncharacterized protein LOC131475314 isoform X4 [Solea solea]|uniref:uncharacterized protein LOC131475314 isoform X4 n=1 Tax=Solea solea TaxID=90069 RepID=UPI00272BD645|nr:uncharacterized protein LOC131475314 isoform X4 [Solea solea]
MSSTEDNKTLMDTSPPSQPNELNPELTLVLIGDTNSIKVGPENILLANDEQTHMQHLSPKLYDLCGRHISVINMLGQQNTENLLLNQGAHVFLLILPNSLDSSQHSAGVQWLEKAFGKESLSYLITVVTHDADAECESALTDLKANTGFDEKRYHACTKTMTDVKEMTALLEKIDVMVSEKKPNCGSRGTLDENDEQKHVDFKSNTEEGTDSSEFQQNQTGCPAEDEGKSSSNVKVKSDLLNEPGDVEHSNNDDSTVAKEDELEETAATVKIDPVNKPGESEQHGDRKDRESEIKSLSSNGKDFSLLTANMSSTEDNETLMDTSPPSQPNEWNPEFTLVLIGDTNSIKVGPENILLANDEQTHMQHLSPKLYDLCGRHISVINMLGQQNTENLLLNQGAHVFLLILPNSLDSSQHSAGVQWLEKAFGKESLSYLITVVTHDADAECESALTDLKANTGFDEKRYHTCTKSMTDVYEMTALLEKIDVMVSEKKTYCGSRGTLDENDEQKHVDFKSNTEEGTDSSEFQQNQTGCPAEDEEKSSSNVKVKSDLLNEPGDVEHSNNDDSPVAKEDELEETAATAKIDPVNKPGEREQHGDRKDRESEIKSLSSNGKDFSFLTANTGSTEDNKTLMDTSPPSQPNELNPEFTLVLIGDTNSIEIGPENILLANDEQTHMQHLSPKLYDLCARHISVINMLGQQNTENLLLNQGAHVFLLILPNSLDSSQHSAGVQWLEKAFGKESLSYLITVVTHDADAECESALTDLKANTGFDEKRYHTCTKSMTDVKEMTALLEKIDVMVSEKKPYCGSRGTLDENDEQKHVDFKSNTEEGTDSSEFQQNQTGCPAEDEGKSSSNVKVKSDLLNEPGDVEHSNNDDSPVAKDELEETAATAKIDPVNKPGEREQHGDRKDRESEIKSLSSNGKDFSFLTANTGSTEDNKTLMDTSPPSQPNELNPEFTLVLIGDTNSIEIGPENILLANDEQTHMQHLSPKLYDLCARHISVINMLGQQNTENLLLNQGAHVFLLILPNSLDSSQHSAGVQWLEKAFGKESLSYLITVVTHDADAECESALTDLKANTGFDEKRYHTCTKSMTDVKEMTALLEKIDVMVSEKKPYCGSRGTLDENDEQKHVDFKSNTEEGTDSSEFQQNQTGCPAEDEGKSSSNVKVKSDLLNEPGDVEHSNNDDSPVAKEDELEETAATAKIDPVNKPGEREQHGDRKDRESEIKSLSSNGKDFSFLTANTGSTEDNKTLMDTSPPSQPNELNPEFTLVLIGDTNSIEIGPENILLANDEQTHMQHLSPKLYDLCARHISVINMLGQQNTENLLLNQGAHVFLLILPNSLDSSQHSAGVQWLEKAFGKESLSYLITVVTHDADAECESALTDLKANTGFDEKRYHTCTKSMTDVKEMTALLEKIDVMVSEKKPYCGSRGTLDENDEPKHVDFKSNTEEGTDSSEFQQNQTGCPAEDEGKSSSNVKVKSDLLNEPGDVEHSNNDDSPVAKEDELEETAATVKWKADGGGSPGWSWSCVLCDPFLRFYLFTRHLLLCVWGVLLFLLDVTSPTKPLLQPSDLLIEPGDVEHSKNDDSPVAKGAADEVNNENKDKVGKMPNSVKISEEIDKENQHQRVTETLLGLDLQDKHQQKLTSEDFLKIGPAMKKYHVTSEKELTNTFLHKLLMLDYRARYIPVKQEIPEVSDSKPIQVCDSAEVEDIDDMDDFFSTSEDTKQTKETHLHPMDIQMAVFHCSDSFLKQNIVSKLSQCQYALPLLVPDPVTMDIECPLWTFRKITKSWKTTDIQTDSKIMKSMPICKAKTPMVSFLRLDSLSVSKSQLINTLINDRHSTFFHKHLQGSNKTRHLVDGMAEIAWYCPAGKCNDAFNDCVAFCNLHGDALLFEKQRDILIEKSSVNVVLVPTLEKGHKSWGVIEALWKLPKPLIILTTDTDGGKHQKKQGRYKISLKDRSHSDITEELKTIIGHILCESQTSFHLESMAEVPGIRVDEDDPVCRKGKTAALEMMNLLKKIQDVTEIKSKFLPCQGQLWHEWSRIKKELYHLTGQIEIEKSKKENELIKIRQDQCKHSCSELIKLFTDNLLSLSSTERQYFLKWTQIFLDDHVTDDLSVILQNYDKTWSEVLALKKKHNKSDLFKSKQTELEQISTKLQSATFGLEHIFREMGQIYEAHKSQKKQECKHTDWFKYPELAAELMISGHPMELMDGDAGNVPLTWISSLLDEVIKKLGDKRVFVLSVLGIQSSGKSTMLNAMFGLEFAVSAGRCTKGAFMQLVKVSEEVKEKFTFDYILVVDTEGLRALELGNVTLHHDNELATFVVGLGNLTLINIFGENPAEMQDILQIVVQAFMRMKQVNLSPSCMFVHQNVTDITAVEKNMDGKRRLQEKLDQMAQLAAKEEVCDVQYFSDVIAFDVEKDVKYLAQLWEGSPPMAPPNPGYCESVQELRNMILSKASDSAGITLSQFKTKIQDLWNALLKENFVFNFKNTFEIAVYRNLEVQFGKWTWILRSNMLTIENQQYICIENGNTDKVELNHLNEKMSKTYEETKQEIQKYFDHDKDKEILVQWRGRFKSKIKDFHEELVKETKRKLDEIIQQKKACKKLNDEKTVFENKLLQKSKELAHQLKDKGQDEKELKKQFDHVWKGWVDELTTDTKPIEDIDFEKEQNKVLTDLGIEWILISDSKRCGRHKELPVWRTDSNYTDPRKWFGKIKNLFNHDHEYIRSFIARVEQQSIDNIKTKPVATRGFQSTYLQEVANNVIKEVTELEAELKCTAKKEFKVDLLLYVFDKATIWLSESYKKFKINNDAIAYLEGKKTQYYDIFKSFCKGHSSAVVFGKVICEKLRSATAQAVFTKTAIDLAGEMKCNFPAFNGNRLVMEKHVLKSLAEKGSFEDYINYIQQPRKHVESYIEEQVKEYIFTDHEDRTMDIRKKNAEDIKKVVNQALFTASENVKTQRGSTDLWLKEFSSLLKDKLTIGDISSENFSDITNFDFLKDEIKRGFKSIIEETNKRPLKEMKESRLKPEKILIDQLCNCCWVTCPFCAAVCTNTLKDHSPNDHSVPFHRSGAVQGWHYRNTVEMSVDFCTTKVASDRSFYPDSDSERLIPYKQYRTADPRFASWNITPDDSELPYWKWFTCQYQKQIEDHYKLRYEGLGKIPENWTKISKEEAIKSLDELFSVREATNK